MALPAELDRTLAAANRWQDWNCWLYTTLGQRLVLRAQSGPAGTGPEDQAYLVFQGVKRSRLPWYWSENPVRFELGVPSDHVHPSSRLDATVSVRLDCGEQSHEVECTDLEFCHGPLVLPPAMHPAVDYIYRSDKIIRVYDAGSGAELRQFLGEPFETLEWSGLHVSHGQLRLLAQGFPGGGAVELRCFGTRYLDLAVTMSRPCIRVASPGESAALRAALPPSLIAHTEPPARLEYALAVGEAPRPGDRLLGGGRVLRPAAQAGHLVIDCEEGRFHLLTAQVALRRLRRRTYAFSRYLSRTFWP